MSMGQTAALVVLAIGLIMIGIAWGRSNVLRGHEHVWSMTTGQPTRCTGCGRHLLPWWRRLRLRADGRYYCGCSCICPITVAAQGAVCGPCARGDHANIAIDATVPGGIVSIPRSIPDGEMARLKAAFDAHVREVFEREIHGQVELFVEPSRRPIVWSPYDLPPPGMPSAPARPDLPRPLPPGMGDDPFFNNDPLRTYKNDQ